MCEVDLRTQCVERSVSVEESMSQVAAERAHLTLDSPSQFDIQISGYRKYRSRMRARHEAVQSAL
jgi:hypothetical protein